VNEKQKACVLVDPGIDIEPVLEYIEQQKLQLEKILLTHAHMDHIYGLAEAKRRFAAPIYMHPDEEPVLASFRTICEDWGIPDEGDPPPADHDLVHGEELRLLGTSCEVRHTPGHTPGQVVFVFDGFAIVGDALFTNNSKGVDIPGSDVKAQRQSIEDELYSLPNETTIYPGHGEFTCIGDERRLNQKSKEAISRKPRV